MVQGRQATGMESRGISQRFPFWCNKTKTARTTGRRSSSSPLQCHDQRLFAGEDYFCQDRLYYLSPFKSRRCGIPSHSYLGRGPRPLHIGLSHHHREGPTIEGPKSEQVEHHTSSRTPHLLRLVHPCTSSSIAPRGNPPHHTGVGYYTTTVARTSINLCVFVSL